jgi:GDPmannose 4,6-dehydratase
VRTFAEMAFREVGIEIEWRGVGVEEKGFDPTTGRVLIEIDPRYFRPTEVDLLLGDPSKARSQLGWAAKTPLSELVREMVASDLAEIETRNARPHVVANH